MKSILIILTVIGLLLTVVPSILVFYGVIEWKMHANLMVVGFFLYFFSAPFWMKSAKTEEL